MDDEFGGGQEVGVAWVFGPKKGPAAFLQEPFEGGLAIDEGSDDLPGRGFTWGEEDDVVFEDVGSDHGVPADAEAEEAGVAPEAERGGIDGHRFVGLDVLGVGGGEAGGDDAEDGDLEQGGAAGAFWSGEGAGFAGLASEGAFFLQGLEVAGDGEGAGEAEVGLDLTERREDVVVFAVGADEIEYGLLAIG